MPLDNAKLQSKSRKFPIIQSLKFKVWILGYPENAQEEKKIIKYVLSNFMQISNFSKFKVQSLDIATLLGVEGPSPLQEQEGWARSAQIF